jgi:hypothetical protein
MYCLCWMLCEDASRDNHLQKPQDFSNNFGLGLSFGLGKKRQHEATPDQFLEKPEENRCNASRVACFTTSSLAIGFTSLAISGDCRTNFHRQLARNPRLSNDPPQRPEVHGLPINYGLVAVIMSVFASSTESKDQSNGITGAYTGDSLALRIVIGSFIAVAWYNAFELNILILVTFKRYGGLYFWSLFVASCGVIFYGIGFLFKFFQIIENDFVNVAFITIGWWCMVTGQSVVLYSRLHLIVLNEKLLRLILQMIIVDAIILHIPTTVLTFGSNANGDTKSFVHGYNVMEKIQMTGFCIQEFVISGIYLWECAKFLRTDKQEKSRKTLSELFYINMIIIMMDLSLLGLEYANLYILEIVTKGMVYSVKLKLEFAILGKLVQYVGNPAGQFPLRSASDVSEFVRPSHNTTTTSQLLSKPKRAHERECPCHLNGESQTTFEHVEANSGGAAASAQYESLHTTDRRRSEDDIEMMMKRYSVS